MSYTYLDLAHEVLRTASVPMIYQDIWAEAERMGLTAKLGATGKTPWQSLGAQLYIGVRDNPNFKVVAVGSRPVRFFLKERAASLPKDVIAKLDAADSQQQPPPKAGNKTPLIERALHPLLAYFAYSNPGFNRGRKIHTKTIFHEKSNKGGFNEWIHPDMVGFYLPFED